MKWDCKTRMLLLTQCLDEVRKHPLGGEKQSLPGRMHCPKAIAKDISMLCKGTKKTVVAVCFDGASGFKRELLVDHYVNHNFELAKKRKLYV